MIDDRELAVRLYAARFPGTNIDTVRRYLLGPDTCASIELATWLRVAEAARVALTEGIMK